MGKKEPSSVVVWEKGPSIYRKSWKKINKIQVEIRGWEKRTQQDVVVWGKGPSN